MLKRTLFFANPAYISTRQEQLVVKPLQSEERTVPIEDIGFVVLEHPQITLTMPALQKLNSNNVAVVFCNDKHHPDAMLLNLDGHHLQGELFGQQISASVPLKKQMWKQTVEAKIRNQAALLKKLDMGVGNLLALATGVKSNDSTNREGAAAREYWKRLMGSGFIRDRYGDPPNPMLNYGYTILRAAVARALVGSGLLPTLGIHHHNRYNAYCLADDIMEPYRPYVDEVVYQLWQTHDADLILDQSIKSYLLNLLTCDVSIEGVKRPLMVALSITTASLSRCYAGEDKKIAYPVF